MMQHEAHIESRHIAKYELVCEKVADYTASPILGKKVSCSEQAADILLNTLRTYRYPVEHFIVFMLDNKLNLIGFSDLSVGTSDRALVDPKEVFRAALMTAKCTAIIVAHNHPSGDPAPSEEDIEITENLIAAGRILGIKVCDHIIAGDEGTYTSLRREQLANFTQ